MRRREAELCTDTSALVTGARRSASAASQANRDSLEEVRDTHRLPSPADDPHTNRRLPTLVPPSPESPDPDLATPREQPFLDKHDAALPQPILPALCAPPSTHAPVLVGRRDRVACLTKGRLGEQEAVEREGDFLERDERAVRGGDERRERE